jgi:hypothetical protein
VGTSDEASLQFEEAMAFCRMAQYRPELAGTFHNFTGMLED